MQKYESLWFNTYSLEAFTDQQLAQPWQHSRCANKETVGFLHPPVLDTRQVIPECSPRQLTRHNMETTVDLQRLAPLQLEASPQLQPLCQAKYILIQSVHTMCIYCLIHLLVRDYTTTKRYGNVPLSAAVMPNSGDTQGCPQHGLKFSTRSTCCS